MQKTAPIVVKRKGPGQQKMGRGMTMGIAYDRRLSCDEFVAAIEEAEQPWTAIEMVCRAPRARAQGG